MADVVAATLTGAGSGRDTGGDTGGATGPSPAARRDGDGWVVDTPDGAVPVEPPRPRPADQSPAGTAPEAGADTAAVLAELGIEVP